MSRKIHPLVSQFVSFVFLLLGLIYVSTPETGILLKFAQSIVGNEMLNPYQKVLVPIQSGLLAIGFHRQPGLRIIVGLAIIVLSSFALFFEKPLVAVGALAKLIATHLWKNSPAERERQVAAFATSSLSTSYASTPDASYLVGGLLTWWLKSGILAAIFIVGATLGFFTYANSVRAQIASSLAKDKLRQYLMHVQLGRIPAHAKALLGDIESFQGQLAAMAPERELTQLTVHTLELIDRRSATPDQDVAEKDVRTLRAATLDMIDKANDPKIVYSYPLAEFDNYYYLSYLLAAGFVGLNELNRHPDMEVDRWIDAIVYHCRKRIKDHPSLASLSLVVDRLDLTHRSQFVIRPAAWAQDPRLMSELDQLVQRWRTYSQKLDWYEDRERSSYNASVTAVMALRMIADGTLGESARASNDYKELHKRVCSQDKVLGACARVADYFDTNSRVEGLMGSNVVFSMTRAETFATIAAFIRYLDSRGDKSSILVGNSLLDVVRPNAVLPAESFERMKAKSPNLSLDIALTAEEILALKQVHESWPAYGVWTAVDKDNSFANGVFWDLHAPERREIVTKAFEKAGVKCPWSR